MTKLVPEKRMQRETRCVDRLRPILVGLTPLYCEIWVKGTRKSYRVPWDAILDLGRKFDARQEEDTRRRA